MDKNFYKTSSSEAALLSQMNEEIYKTSFSPNDVLLSLKEVQKLTGFSKAWIYKALRQSGFPRPLKIGKRRIVFIQAEVLSYINKCVQARNQKICTEANNAKG